MASPSDGDKHLILCVDGVPYDAVERLQQQGVFQRFHPASRLVSPFPSMTNVALKELFHAAPPSGYEAFYFDRQLNRLCGGASNYVGDRANSVHVRTYHHFVDYQEPVHYEFLVYVLPQEIYRADVQRFRAAFAASDKPVFVGYLKSTDGLIHLGGQEKLDWAMRWLDDQLLELSEGYRGRLRMTLFSDHGNYMMRGRRLRLKDHLRHWQYQVGSRWRSETSVVVPEFGLVGFASIYTPADPAALARELAEVEGVDFAIYRHEETVVVSSRAGQAMITYDPANARYRYQADNADPLELTPALQQLKDQGRVGADGFVHDRDWFEATVHHHFPDIVWRVYQAMSDQVVNRADILLSLQDGVYAGHVLFDGMVELVATHGSARATSSTGFMMSTDRRFPPHLRASDVPSYLPFTPHR